MRPSSLSILFAIACGGSGSDSGAPADDTCRFAIVTDIDETLTTSDDEWIAQLVDASHDAAMRPSADVLMNEYADLGYTIFYVTARGEDTILGDGRTAREATADWLEDHGFPYEPERLFLAEGIAAVGDEAVAYKSQVMLDHIDQGWTYDYGYGNADTDIEGFRLGGLADDRLFLVGELAGTMGVNPIPDEEAYETHLTAHMSSVTSPCD